MTSRTRAEYNWPKLQFNERWLSKHYTPLGGRTIKGFTVHHMTIVGKGTGSALDACYSTWQKRQASAHYGVDSTLVTQFVHDKDYAWATSSSKGNLDTISVEHANSTAGPKWLVDNATIMTGARLIANGHVLYKLGRPRDRVTLWQHDNWFATACPGPFLGGTQWAAYVRETQRVYDVLMGRPDVKPEPAVRTAVWGKPETWWLGAIGADVARLGERILVWSKALGLPSPYRVGPGEPYGPADVVGLQALQIAWGYGSSSADKALGGSSDGYPGPVTFSKLDTNPPAKSTTPAAPKAPTGLGKERVVQWNVAGYNSTQGTGRVISEAEQDRRSKARVPGLVAQLKRRKADVIGLCEASAAMVAGFDSGLEATHARARFKGRKYGDGREIYVGLDYRIVTTRYRHSTARYRGDDKPIVGVVYEPLKGGPRRVVVVWHGENEDGPGTDDIRVKQMEEGIDLAEDLVKAYDVPAYNVTVTGDGNSSTWCADRAEKVGYHVAHRSAKKRTNAARQTLNEWKSTRAGAPIDLTLVPDDVVLHYWGQATVAPAPELSDHNMTITDRAVRV